MANTDLGKVSLTPKGAYETNTYYERLDIVEYGGSSYIVLKDIIGITPANDGINYLLLVSKGDRGIQGVQGVQGIQGIQGKQGIQGMQGEKGEPLTYEDLTEAQKDELISKVTVDPTLTHEGQAADAKAVTDEFEARLSGITLSITENGKLRITKEDI